MELQRNHFAAMLLLCVAVDIWSAGCIMAEMLLGKPLFKGNDRILVRLIDLTRCHFSYAFENAWMRCKSHFVL